MATQDWPSDADFKPSDFSVGADVPLAQWRGVNTGVREIVSRASDRIVATLTLPPCTRTVAARRESFIAYLLSTGDNVRIPMFHRRYPLGNMSGSPTVNGAVSVGARSIVLAGVKAGSNLLLNSGFELDTNSDGLSDGLTLFETAAVSSTTFNRGSGSTGYFQIVTASGLGTTSGDRSGFYFASVNVTGGAIYTLAADITGSVGASQAMRLDFFDGSSSLLAGSIYGTWSGTGVPARRTVTNQAPSAAVTARLHVFLHSSVSGSAAMDVDNVQIEQASTASAYAGLATALGGDFIGIGGNLLQVAYAGATANDAGGMTVPLVYPVQKAISNGAAVTLSSPTGVWQLDAVGLRFDHSVGGIQDGIVLPFRQVIA